MNIRSASAFPDPNTTLVLVSARGHLVQSDASLYRSTSRSRRDRVSRRPPLLSSTIDMLHINRRRGHGGSDGGEAAQIAASRPGEAYPSGKGANDAKRNPGAADRAHDTTPR